ncbi:signal-transducing adaptor protein 2 [Balearica regulorum gibbericeps]|uniref:signal-transducing adaptor protein 2 n=1 Tax=Balearica regulorum gibbericeps TaxID=100784 RepID=UPI003F5E3F25
MLRSRRSRRSRLPRCARRRRHPGRGRPGPAAPAAPAAGGAGPAGGTAPPRDRHSYEGFVEKRGPRDRGSRGVWAGLRGVPLAFRGGTASLGQGAGGVPEGAEAWRTRVHGGGGQGGPTLGCPQPLAVLDLGELVAVRAEGGGLVLRLRGREVALKGEGPHGVQVPIAVLLQRSRVNRVDQGYVIDVDTPVMCPPSMAEVVRFFVESSKGGLRPPAPRLQPAARGATGGLRGLGGSRGMVLGVVGGGGSLTTARLPPAQPRGLRVLKPSPSPPSPVLQPPGGGPGGAPPFGAIPEEQTYVTEQGERDPQSSAPHPAPLQAVTSPPAGMAEELPKKLQLRRALIED